MDAAKLEDLTTHKGFTIRVIKGSSHELYADLIRKYAPEIKIDFATSSRVGAKVKNKEIGLQKVDLGFVDKIGFVLNKKNPNGQLHSTSSFRRVFRKLKVPKGHF
jgi:hypothetical protein